MRPSTAFQVKVKAFNNKGDGPYSLTAVINSAQDGEQKAHGLDEGATRASREALALLPFGPYLLRHFYSIMHLVQEYYFGPD